MKSSSAVMLIGCNADSLVAPAERGRLEQPLEREQWELTAPFCRAKPRWGHCAWPRQGCAPGPSPRLGWFSVPVGLSQWAGLDKLEI